MIRATSSKLANFAAAVLLLIAAAPAIAEQLTFDHRLSPPLKAVLDADDPAKIAYNAKDPRFVTDLIAVRGASAQDWTEALMIIARTPRGKVRSARDWAEELRDDAARHCAGTLTTLAEDEASITLQRRSTGCPADYPPFAIYRVVAGKRSLFLLAAMSKDAMGDDAQAQWRAVLASAHIK